MTTTTITADPTCRLCGEVAHIDCYGNVTHRDGLGSHDAVVVLR